MVNEYYNALSWYWKTGPQILKDACEDVPAGALKKVALKGNLYRGLHELVQLCLASHTKYNPETDAERLHLNLLKTIELGQGVWRKTESGTRRGDEMELGQIVMIPTS